MLKNGTKRTRADDTIILMQDEVEGVRNMNLLLYLFEQMLGLKINFQKSEVIMVMRVEDKGSLYADMLNCHMAHDP